MIPIPLETVRPFVFKSIDLQSYAVDYAFDEGDTENKVASLAKEHVERMILEAKQLETGHENQPTEPLIRLRLVYENEDHMFNGIRFGQEFASRVANSGDLVKFKKLVRKTKGGLSNLDGNALQEMTASAQNNVEDVVDEYFEAAEDSKKLQIMSTKILHEITNRIVQRNDMNAADTILQ